MNKSKFKGGVHQTDGFDKKLTADRDIVFYIPETVNVSMKQGLGPASKCLVSVGDEVSQGQLIGEASHFLSAHVHSPVTGTVLEVSETSCKISVNECKLPSKDSEYNLKWMDISAYSKEEIIDSIAKAGIVGMGGAGFPAAVKYQTKSPITHLLINAAECEPYLTCDEHNILEFGMSFLNGVQLLKKASGAENAIICIEDNKPHCVERLNELLKGHETEISVMPLPTRYPQGGEKQLIFAAMGVEIPSGKLPADVGAIFAKVHTAKAVADMVLGGMPSICRTITVTGDVAEPLNYLVPIGTCIGELVEKSGDVSRGCNRVILGGPMTGRCIGVNLKGKDITDCVSKVSGGLIVLEGKVFEESACIKCGACVEACPIGLNPTKIDASVRKNDLNTCQSLDATECIACGCCSYVCPARRELTYHTVLARDSVRAKMREEAANNGK